ncbi:GFA family protein [Ramlibacter rhizophilus]|uniref:GFA family protein n=1 Tax=Ramlibacter rhizophilus TaxID=1781167 RepID=A0A4Z0BZW1_9BURK|nr:GFA family protein [Ramlibacter rhizophilus]TFZ03499.1 GFA family protein [Ramlibacter rhizophilus]
MHLEGSCHCGKVGFSVEATEPVPFMRCYCSICRKTAGAGGYAINLGAATHSMKVRGKRFLRIYQARLESGEVSEARRYFCSNCGSALWLWDPRWPELVHPHAGAIDTPLPVPPGNVHIMLGSKASWVAAEGHAADPRFEAYPDFSLAEWHQAHGLGAPPAAKAPQRKKARKAR